MSGTRALAYFVLPSVTKRKKRLIILSKLAIPRSSGMTSFQNKLAYLLTAVFTRVKIAQNRLLGRVLKFFTVSPHYSKLSALPKNIRLGSKWMVTTTNFQAWQDTELITGVKISLYRPLANATKNYSCNKMHSIVNWVCIYKTSH